MHTVIMLFVSFIALIWAANHLVVGASGLAHRFKFPPLIMGLTVVALGTSIPELIFSIIASLKNENNLTTGNTIGANIANISLVLGITILIQPQTLNYHHLKKTYPVLLIAMLFAYTLIIDGYLSRVDGCLFLLSCLIAITLFIYWAYRAAKEPFFDPLKNAMINSRSVKINILGVLLGLLVLSVSTKYLIENAAQLATFFNMSTLTIGLTIQAMGTTLPVLSTAVIAAVNGEEDLAIGTILGSNIYNLLLVMAFPALINPIKIDTILLWRDMPVMISLVVFLLFLNYNYKKELSPWHGGVLILIYGCYISSLIIKAST